MKRIICFILCLLFAVSVISGCDTQKAPELSETETGLSTTDAVTEKEPEVDDTVYISAKDYYNNGYSNNYIVGIDKLGRSFDASLPETDKDRQVGVFYYLSGDNAETEPLFGDRAAADVWAIRRRLQLLTSAGVDFICLDVNESSFDTVYPAVMNEICSLKNQDFNDVPEAVFYIGEYSAEAIKKLYEDIYEKELYKDAWYYRDGKPLIITYGKEEDLTEKITDFFTFRLPENDPQLVFAAKDGEWDKYGDEAILIDISDAEMMKGGFEDNFYMQLCKNIKEYKGAALEDTRVKSAEISIPMIEDTTEWNKVKSVFKSVGRDNTPRSSAGAIPSLEYTQPAARNNIYEIRVTESETHLFFYIKTDGVILPREDGDNGWMNIFIGTGELELKGWCGYEYVINRGASNGKTTIDKLYDDFSCETVGEGVYYLSGNILQVKIPKAALGIEGSANIYFKAADGIDHPEDIMDYYVSGRSLPMGRLSFRYIG